MVRGSCGVWGQHFPRSRLELVFFFSHFSYGLLGNKGLSGGSEEVIATIIFLPLFITVIKPYLGQQADVENACFINNCKACFAMKAK